MKLRMEACKKGGWCDAEVRVLDDDGEPIGELNGVMVVAWRMEVGHLATATLKVYDMDMMVEQDVSLVESRNPAPINWDAQRFTCSDCEGVFHRDKLHDVDGITERAMAAGPPDNKPWMCLRCAGDQ